MSTKELTAIYEPDIKDVIAAATFSMLLFSTAVLMIGG